MADVADKKTCRRILAAPGRPAHRPIIHVHAHGTARGWVKIEQELVRPVRLLKQVRLQKRRALPDRPPNGESVRGGHASFVSRRRDPGTTNEEVRSPRSGHLPQIEHNLRRNFHFGLPDTEHSTLRSTGCGGSTSFSSTWGELTKQTLKCGIVFSLCGRWRCLHERVVIRWGADREGRCRLGDRGGDAAASYTFVDCLCCIDSGARAGSAVPGSQNLRSTRALSCRGRGCGRRAAPEVRRTPGVRRVPR